MLTPSFEDDLGFCDVYNNMTVPIIEAPVPEQVIPPIPVNTVLAELQKEIAQYFARISQRFILFFFPSVLFSFFLSFFFGPPFLGHLFFCCFSVLFFLSLFFVGKSK